MPAKEADILKEKLKVTLREKVLARSENIFREILIVAKSLNIEVKVNEQVLAEVIMKYFEWSEQHKSFNGIEKTRRSKIYAHTMYWMIKKHPIISLSEIGTKDANIMITFWLFLPKILRTAGIKFSDVVKTEKTSKILGDASNLLLDNIKNYDVPARTLEMAIEFFISGAKISNNLSNFSR